mgnify:CR=1 FL=1
MYESVSAGAHTVSFKAVAEISGSYGVPPTHVFVTENPSIVGMSSAARLEICESNERCPVEINSQDFAASECRTDCNDNGACDLSSGQCVCFYGFTGADCQRAGVA